MYCEWQNRHSETDIHRMELKRAAEGGAVLNTSYVLAKVVQALGNIQTTTTSSTRNMGSSIFAFGSQIATSGNLVAGQSQHSSERGSVIAVSPHQPRSRAVSGYNKTLTVPLSDGTSNGGDWAWNGKRRSMVNERKYSDVHFITGSGGDSENSSVSLNIEDEGKPVVHSSVNESFLSKINPFKKKSSDEEEILKDISDLDTFNYGIRKSSLRRDSKASLVKQMRRQSTLQTIDSEENILENTTIADLIRALAVAHTQEVLEPNSTLEDIPTIMPTKPEKGGGGRRSSMFPIRRNESFHAKAKRRQSLNPQPIPENFLMKYESLFGLMDSPTDEKVDHTFSEEYLLTYDSPFGLMDTPLERELNTVAKPPSEVHRKFSLFPSSLLGGETSGRSMFSRRASQQTSSVASDGVQPASLLAAKNISWQSQIKESSSNASDGSASPKEKNDTERSQSRASRHSMELK